MKECEKEKFCPLFKVTCTVPLKAGWRIALKVKFVCILQYKPARKLQAQQEYALQICMAKNAKHDYLFPALTEQNVNEVVMCLKGRHYMVMNILLPLQSSIDIKSGTWVSLCSLIFNNKLLLPPEIVSTLMLLCILKRPWSLPDLRSLAATNLLGLTNQESPKQNSLIEGILQIY